MSDVGGNYGETSESATDAASDADEKNQLHETEAKAGDVSPAAKSEAATEATAQQTAEAQLHSAEASTGDVSPAEKSEAATEAAAQRTAEAQLRSAEAQDDWSNAGVQKFTPNYPPPIPPRIQSGLMLNTRVAVTVFFIVTIDTVELGAWAKCSGLGMKIGSQDRKESGMTLFEHNLPGNLHYEHITLERPATSDSRAVMSWFMSYHMLPIPTSGAITCMGEEGAPIMSWELTGITPVSWTGPSFDASSPANFGTEKLTFAHMGFL